jgi:hypothetical protein
MAQNRGRLAEFVNFFSVEQADAWFQRQPREVCIALAMRSALRVLPRIEVARRNHDFAPHITLRVLRPCFVAWIIAKYPSQRDRLRSHAASAARHSTAAFSDATDTLVGLAEAAIADSVAVAAAAAAGTATDPVAMTAAAVKAAATGDTLGLAATLTHAVQADAVAIEQGRAVAEIVAAPLWPVGMPERIAADWGRLRTWMREDQANSWHPWVQWYERVRDGRPSFGEAFDLAVASLTNEQWNEEPVPAAVNHRIAALLAEHTPTISIPPDEKPEPIPLDQIDEKSLPQQTPRAPIFQPNQSGVIDLAPPTAADRLADTPEVRDLYKETREKLDELISVGRNMLGDRLARASDRLCSRMPEAMGDAVEWLVWSSGNTLRSILSDHIAVADDRDPHPNKLDLGVVGRLRDVVDTFNQLAVADPSLRAHDAIRPGPQEHARTLVEIKIVAQPVAEAATDRNITTPQAGEQLAESAAIAKEAGSSLTDRLDVELTRDTYRNFNAGIVVRAYRFFRNLPAQAKGQGDFISKEYFSGVYKYAGGATVVGVAGAVVGAYYIRWEIIQFIVSNADLFRMYAAYAFEQSPGFKQMIDWLEAHVRIEK